MVLVHVRDRFSRGDVLKKAVLLKSEESPGLEKNLRKLHGASTPYREFREMSLLTVSGCFMV